MSVPYDDNHISNVKDARAECDHEWKDSYCTACSKECACVAGEAEFKDGECTSCGYECEHRDMDDAQCLDCGKDRTEDLMAAAYDRAKDFRKYGE